MLCIVAWAAPRAELKKCLVDASARDTTCLVWVVFRDKDAAAQSPPVSPRVLQRRVRGASARPQPWQDAPVKPQYATVLRQMGMEPRQAFRWANAVSCRVSARLLPSVAALPFVKSVLPVASWSEPASPQTSQLDKSTVRITPGEYGECLTHMDMASVPPAHVYIQSVLDREPGAGILIASFDAGFIFKHKCLDYAKQRSAVIADSDFVLHTGNAYHPDTHGDQTLALIAGWDPGTFVGIAWGARYVLARTEIDSVERHIEEDNWVAALVWAESLGVDIVTSSVGYRSGFTNGDADYSFEAMDGQTTTISRMAAQYAEERGVIIVNAMGNDGPGTGTISVPADAQGVVAVGSVNVNGKVVFSSSRGPTSDGRIKPDVVAMGEGVPAPRADRTTGYTALTGTSFAAPIVAGICALILQAHPGESASRIRQYLYASCRFLPPQTTVDNSYGRGMPDAFAACVMDSQSVCYHVRDRANLPLAGVPVSNRSLTPMGFTDSAGRAIVRVPRDSLPYVLNVGSAGDGFGVADTVRETPAGKTITLDPAIATCAVRYLRDGGYAPAIGATVLWQRAGTDAVQSTTTDTAGNARAWYVSPGTFLLTVRARGFEAFGPESVFVARAEQRDTTIAVTLEPIPVDKWRLYPTVIRLSRSAAPTLTYDFSASETDVGYGTQRATVAVRTLAGALVWTESRPVEEAGPVSGSWKLTSGNRRVAPGTYVFSMKYAGKTYVRRFLVLP